jgi:hypothetical protein
MNPGRKPSERCGIKVITFRKPTLAILSTESWGSRPRLYPFARFAGWISGPHVFEGIVIAPQGTGRLDGVGGTGFVRIDLSDGFHGSFNAAYEVNPFVTRGKHR